MITQRTSAYSDIQTESASFKEFLDMLDRAARGEKESFITPPAQIQRILDLIQASAGDEANRHYVDLLGIPCGIGKSTAVSWMIRETLLRSDGHGLIVITDDLGRLNDYLNPHDAELAHFLTQHKDEITLMDAQNASETYQQQFLTPVLLMTTQRFLAMSQTQFAQYLTWQGGDRPLILIDEYVPLKEIAILSLADINDIATMLEQGITNSANQVDKQWCIDQWEQVRTRLSRKLKYLENIHPEEQVSSFFYSNPTRRMTEDDVRFWRILQSNLLSLRAYKSGRTLKSLLHMYRIEQVGALYQGRKGDAYSNKFAIAIDHCARFTNLSAKTIILDGTADLHPDYHQNYIRRIDVRADPLLQRSLKHLTIRLFDVPTSKRRLLAKENGQALQQCIVDEIVRMTGEAAWTIPLFTYSDTERFFRKAGFQHVEHFGNIKGSNQYRNETQIIQIGLNRCEPLYYDAYALYAAPQRIKRLRTMTPEQSAAAIKPIIGNPSAIRKLMNRMLLVDIEQNLYRSAIRNTDCIQDVEYWIFLNTNECRDLIGQMHERYDSLGAHIILHTSLPRFKEFKGLTRKTQTPTAFQLYTAYINALPKGTLFTRSNILSATGIKASAFNSMLRAHPEHKKRLEDMRVPGKGRVYCKQ